jgi:L-aspartate oxidase
VVITNFEKRYKKYVFLDISHKPKNEILSHFPNIASTCLQYGLDITRKSIPIVPAAHYMCGGVRVGLQGEKNVKGLYVAVGALLHIIEGVQLHPLSLDILY